MEGRSIVAHGKVITNLATGFLSEAAGFGNAAQKFMRDLGCR